MVYDVIIVGGGPSGLTAALYAARAGRKVLVLEKDSFGGQIIYSPVVDNYPACPHISGAEIGDKMAQQALDAGAELMSAEVTGIVYAIGENFTVQSDMGDFKGRSLILATGVRHRQLGLYNEKDLVGNGVSYCAVCDGAFYTNKKVAVIGGGDTALKAALFLSDRCREVVLIHRRNEFRAEKILVDQAEKRSNITFMMNKKVVVLQAPNNALDGVELEDTIDEHRESLKVDGVFVTIGQEPQSEPFALMGLTDDLGYFDFDETTITHIDGLFVAGDARAKNVRQLTTAVADGATAGLAAAEYTRIKKESTVEQL